MGVKASARVAIVYVFDRRDRYHSLVTIGRTLCPNKQNAPPDVGWSVFENIDYFFGLERIFLYPPLP